MSLFNDDEGHFFQKVYNNYEGSETKLPLARLKPWFIIRNKAVWIDTKTDLVLLLIKQRNNRITNIKRGNIFELFTSIISTIIKTQPVGVKKFATTCSINSELLVIGGTIFSKSGVVFNHPYRDKEISEGSDIYIHPS